MTQSRYTRAGLAAGLAGIMALGVVAHGAQSADPVRGRDATPDYARVFAQDRVGRIDIRVTAADWQALVADMEDMAGPFGTVAPPGNMDGGGRFGGFVPPSEAEVQACAGRVEGNACAVPGTGDGGRCVQMPPRGLACVALGGGRVDPGGGPAGVGGQGDDDVELLPRTPVYVAATVTFDGEVFPDVGLRLKGNSTLVNSWRSGVLKLPFRLNFDRLEDRNPDVRDQTFFGFPNLNLTNSASDASYLRAKVVSDLFREAGVPSPATAFVTVYLDRGEGAEYLGVYTLVEVPDDPMLETWFGSDDGNLYKPRGTGGRWTEFLASSFPKKTNRTDEDWTDIQDAIEVLNEPRDRAQTWRFRLEARFEVDAFLRWLALNTIIGNFDTYGGLSAHNYWLYGSPRHRDRLFWIAWDHDLAMSGFEGGGGGGGAGGGGDGGRNGGPPDGGVPPGDGRGGGLPPAGQAALDLFHDTVGDEWPLIRFLLDDDVYRNAYRGHVEDLLGTVFTPNAVVDRLTLAHALIAPYVAVEEAGRTFQTDPEEFDRALTGAGGLIEYVDTRYEQARRVLEQR